MTEIKNKKKRQVEKDSDDVVISDNGDGIVFSGKLLYNDALSDTRAYGKK